MAKKDPAEMPVEDKLKNLYQLQVYFSEIDKKRAVRGELPLEVQDLADEIVGLKVRVEKIQQDIAEFKAASNKNQGEMTVAKQQVERYKQQLDDVKNNREYDTLTKEIDYQNLAIKLCEKKIKEAKDDVEKKTKSLAEVKETLKKKEEDYKEKNGELQELIDETKAEEDKLIEKAKELEQKIEPRLLTSFKRIRKNARNGLGVVYVQRDACGGCFNKIPPQRQLDIKMHKKIIVCEYCGRILIDPELAGVKEAKAEETKPKKKRSTKKKAAEKLAENPAETPAE